MHLPIQSVFQQQSFHPTVVQPRLHCVNETTQGALTLQAGQAELNRLLQLSTDNAKAVGLESKTLAAQMVAQVFNIREVIEIEFENLSSACCR